MIMSILVLGEIGLVVYVFVQQEEVSIMLVLCLYFACTLLAFIVPIL